MHRIALTLSLIVSIAGCAHRPIAVENEPGAFSPEPLSVRLLAPYNGSLRYVVSEPAYVAIFEIVPELGVSLLYPSSRGAMPRLSAAGFNSAFMPRHAPGRWFYSDAQFHSAISTFSRPRYLYIIASKSPLPIEELHRSPGLLRNRLGWSSFLATDLSGTLDDIERLVAGSLAEDEWTSDLYVIWPENPPNRPWRSLYTFISCGDGRTVLVPVEWNIHACPGSRQLAQATKPPTPPTTKPEQPPTIPSDSTDLQPPPNIRGGPRPLRPMPPPDRVPADAPIDRRGKPEGDDRSGRPAAVPRPIEREPSPAPVPRVDPPRPTPSPQPRAETPRSEPPRSEPRPAAPPRSEPVERKPAETP